MYCNCIYAVYSETLRYVLAIPKKMRSTEILRCAMFLSGLFSSTPNAAQASNGKVFCQTFNPLIPSMAFAAHRYFWQSQKPAQLYLAMTLFFYSCSITPYLLQLTLCYGRYSRKLFPPGGFVGEITCPPDLDCKGYHTA